MKQFFTYTFYTKKTARFLFLFLVFLMAMPIIEIPQAEAQTTKTGNFFTRRFTRKSTFKRKSKKSTAFQRKPFKCEDVGKTKVEQVKVSKKQLRRWEEERLVKAEQEEAKQQRLAKTTTKKDENTTISASSKNDMKEIASQKNNTTTKKKEEKKEEPKLVETKTEETKTIQEEKTEPVNWYSSEKPSAPKISPIIINQKNEITNQKNKQELEIAAKHARLGYSIVLESNNEKQVQAVKKYLISIGTEEESIKIKSSENETENEIAIQIEK